MNPLRTKVNNRANPFWLNASALLRTMAAAMLLGEVSRFPALGRLVFSSVPESSAKHLAAYLKEQTKLGVLDVKNPARAAWVFMEMLQGDVHLKALLNPRVKLSPPDVRKSVEAAVDLFLNGARPRALPVASRQME